MQSLAVDGLAFAVAVSIVVISCPLHLSYRTVTPVTVERMGTSVLEWCLYSHIVVSIRQTSYSFGFSLTCKSNKAKSTQPHGPRCQIRS